MISCREMYEKTVLTFSIAFSDEPSIFRASAYQTQVINIIKQHLYAEYFTDRPVHQENAR